MSKIRGYAAEELAIHHLRKKKINTIETN